jgi:rhodanese-related sulfurtransferase
MSATVSASDLDKRRRAGEKIDLIDVRTPAEFRSVHVEFARNIPLDEFDPEAVLRGRTGDAAAPLYLICKSGSRSRMASEKLERSGFAGAVQVDGGTDACVQAGLPVVRGKSVMSLERQVRVSAGSIVLIGILLGWFVHRYFLGISAFVGGGLVFSGLTDTCGMGSVLARMPWNRK